MILLIAVGLTISPITAKAVDISASTFAELKSAFNTVSPDPDIMIRITEDIDMVERLIVPVGKNVTLLASKADGSNVALNRAAGIPVTQTMMQVSSGSSLTVGAVSGAKVVFNAQNRYSAIADGGTFVTNLGRLTLNQSSFTGGNNRGNNAGSIAVIGSTAQMMINAGALITNNYTNINSWNSTGGVYVRHGGTVTMQGGEISDNTGPSGGVQLGDLGGANPVPSTLNLVAGTIKGNTANGPYAMGGGVMVASPGTLNMSGGTIDANHARFGGGVAVFDMFVVGWDGSSYSETYPNSYEVHNRQRKAEFNMTGGTISNNVAETAGSRGSGGGIYVSSSNVNLQAGKIINNTSGNMGGGIYVSIYPYELKLRNAVITQNHAISGNYLQHPPGDGGGIWNCPIGTFNIYPANGIYIFDNTADRSGADYYARMRNADYLSNYYDGTGHNPPMVTVGDRFEILLPSLDPDGRPIDWYRDEAGARHAPSAPREFPPEDTLSILDVVAGVAKVEYSTAEKAQIVQNAQLLIMGNTALKGGGVGTNADTTIGDGEEMRDIPVRKTWADDIANSEIPDSVVVLLLLDKQPFRKMTLYRETDYYGVFKDIPLSYEERRFSIEVQEVPTPGMVAIISGDALNGFTVHNTKFVPTPTPSPVLTVPVVAEKLLHGGTLRESQFQFVLTDGQGKVLQQKGNDAQGKVIFEPRTFSNTGDYHYFIREVQTTTPGKRYDTTEYRIIISVSVHDTGLQAKASVERNGIPYAGKLVFTNYADVPPTGDSTHIQILMLLMMVAGILGIVTMLRRRNKPTG